MSLPPLPYKMIADQAGLDAVTRKIAPLKRLSLDTEADSMHHYREKICLIQMSADGEHFVIDPLAGLELSGFLGVLKDKDLIFHGADYDLYMLKLSFGFRPAGEVFDTKIAAQLLGYKEFGLAALVDKFYGVKLDKHNQRADWSERPLGQRLLDYAVRDTVYLEEMAQRFAGELQELGRLGWHGECCARMVETALEEKEYDPEEAWKIKGWFVLSRNPRGMAFLREVWRWRDSEASRADIPGFKIMDSERMVKLAVWFSGKPEPLTRATIQQALEGGETGLTLPRHCTGQRLQALVTALETASVMPREGWPVLKRTRLPHGPDCSKEIDFMRAECARIAAGLGLDPSLIAPRSVLEALARKKPATFEEMRTVGPMMRWQAGLMEPSVQKMITMKFPAS